jgi:hypothetical protein
MPLDKRRDVRVIAVVFGDLMEPHGMGDGPDLARTHAALDRVNGIFEPAVAEPFSLTPEGRLDGVLTDPAQVPLLVSVLRETLAPVLVRVGVGIGAGATPDMGAGGDAYSLARRALEMAARDRGLTRYAGTGEGGDVLLAAICRLVDPLVAARTAKQWQAIAAYRELGHQRDVAERLGVTRQSVGDRLAAGHRRAVEDADAAIAAYLSYLRRRRVSA